MSLTRAALRLCTVRALRGQTWVGDAVRDSEQGPIDESAELPQPGVAVFTDDGKFGASQRDLLAGGELNLVIEILVTQRMSVKVADDGDDQVIWESPATDAALEFTLDMIERQIKVALLDPTNAWAELWREFAPAIGASTTQRGASMREGVRFAGRQLVLPVTVVKDPPPNQAPAAGTLWARFLDKVDATADLAPIAVVFRQAVTGAASWPGWQALAAAYGLTLAEAEALLIAPPEAAQGASPAFAPELGLATEVGP